MAAGSACRAYEGLKKRRWAVGCAHYLPPNLVLGDWNREGAIDMYEYDFAAGDTHQVSTCKNAHAQADLQSLAVKLFSGLNVKDNNDSKC